MPCPQVTEQLCALGSLALALALALPVARRKAGFPAENCRDCSQGDRLRATRYTKLR
jgi:hypothetical protein